MIALQILTVGTWTGVETVSPRTTDQFDEVFVARLVLGQDNEVVATLVALIVLEKLRTIA